MRTILGAVFIALATSGHLASQAADGAIAGRVVDASASFLPGVRVTVDSGNGQRAAITDNDGRFIFDRLPLGTYRVAMDLPGFATRSGTITLTPETLRAHLAWSMDVGCIETITVIADAREAAPRADSILHVRIAADNGAMLWSTRPECPGSVVQSYTVDVVNTIARRGTGPDRAAREIVLSNRAGRLTPREEYLVFLGSDSLAGAGLIFPVTSGRITSGELLAGMRLEEAVATLRTWARARPR